MVLRIFPLDSLPLEMKEMVFAKVNGNDSPKLLRVTKDSRNFALRHGFFNKPLAKIEITFARDHIDYKLFGTSSEGECYSMQVYGSCALNYRHNRNNQMFKRILSTIRSTNFLDVKVDPKCRLLGPADFPLKLDHILEYRINFRLAAELRLIAKAVQPKHVNRLYLHYDEADAFVGRQFTMAAQHKVELAHVLKRLLDSCETIRFNFVNTTIESLLPQTQIKNIDLLFLDRHRFNATVRTIFEHGVPSLNPEAKVYLRYVTSSGEKFCFNEIFHGLLVKQLEVFDSCGIPTPLVLRLGHVVRKYWNEKTPLFAANILIYENCFLPSFICYFVELKKALYFFAHNS